MKRTTKVGGFIVLLLGALLMFVAIHIEDAPAPSVNIADSSASVTPTPLSPAQKPRVVNQKSEAAREVSSLPSSEKPQRQVGNPIGVTQKLVQLDFEKYLVFAGTASAAEQSNQQMLSAVKARYELTENEMARLITQAAVVVHSDREHQRMLQQEICADKSRYPDLYSFGVALNEFDRSVEANQARLALQAESTLGAELFSKIHTQLAHQPQRHVSVVDGSVFLPASNRELSEVIQSFCSVPILNQG